MARKRKMKKGPIFVFILILLVGCGAFYALKSNFFGDTNIDNSDKGEKVITSFISKISYDKKVKNEINSKAQKVILTLMDLYYRSMKELYAYDVTDLFDSSAYEQAQITQTALSLLVDIRASQSNDLSFASCSYDIEYTNVTETNNDLVITFNESNTIRFNFIKDTPSSSYDIENKITLRKVDNDYKVVSYEKVDDFYKMINDSYTKSDKTKDLVMNDLTNLRDSVLFDVKSSLNTLSKEYASYVSGEVSTKPTCDNPYDRQKASAYAKEWINKRNSDWLSFDTLGGNCNNYASQAILAGGIPMDYNGSIGQQWKYYSSAVNEAAVAQGRSYSWTGVNQFYSYAKYNKGYGMCAKVDANMYMAEPGDIIQVGPVGSYSHTVIVTDVIKKDGKVVEILIGSNSVDRENYPLSAYNYPNRRLIKIYGWNN